jgi:hypothetical protein
MTNYPVYPLVILSGTNTTVTTTSTFDKRKYNDWAILLNIPIVERDTTGFENTLFLFFCNDYKTNYPSEYTGDCATIDETTDGSSVSTPAKSSSNVASPWASVLTFPSPFGTLSPSSSAAPFGAPFGAAFGTFPPFSFTASSAAPSSAKINITVANIIINRQGNTLKFTGYLLS